MREKRTIWKRIIPAGILLICIIASFAVYLNVNRHMTVSRNAKYVKDAATQTAKRIEDLLVGAENSISAIAHLYGQNMDPDRIDLDTLQKLVDDTPFDYIGIVSTDGIYTDNHGKQAQVSDRYYFQDGMLGHSGMDIIFNGRIAHENLMIFYAPLWYDGEIAGILTGRYGEYQMREIIAATYFEEPADTYLCLSDGTVFSTSSENDPPENILTSLQEADGADRETLAALEEALENGYSRSLTYTSKQGSNAAYITKLPEKDWMLLQIFPIRVTNAMLNESNAIAMYLELWLVLLFAVYILILLMENRRQKAKLVMEKQEMREIVDSTSQLFSNFVLADLKNDSYEYLKNDIREYEKTDNAGFGKVLPQKGIYSQLRDYWAARIIQEDEYVPKQLTISSIRQNLTADTPFLQYEYRVQENSIRWKQISVLCIKREKGIPASVLMAVQDVTELKEAELKNRMAMEEAYQAAKAANEAKTVFLSNMSHDMRTPMNAIIGFSTLLDRDASQPDKVREYNGKIAASGRHLLNLINDVLDISKIESGQKTLNISEFNLKELLEELSSVIRPQIREKQQSLDVRVCDVNGERFLGDRLRLSQILLNLLSNAVKYTPEGGQIELAVLGLPETSRGYAHLRFQVQDNGIGISPEFLKHIFDPFTRENNSTASGILGTGLGMAITRNLVDLMGGTISVESTQGVGSTFRVELELRYCEQPAETSHPEEAILPASGASELEGLKVLIAEDNDINAEILEELLSYEGVSCDRTINGQEALERFRQTPPGCYDAVLMDIQMPVMNGYEAARAIRDLDRPDAGTIPIVAMTANAFAEDVQNAMEAGMNAHLSKPIDMTALKGVLEKLIHSENKS
ncbi:MAG: ATP-binding protein [Candidatus Limivivens sp.]|nr:ATP-binding protein [Candidatus Limivivens sp.]